MEDIDFKDRLIKHYDKKYCDSNHQDVRGIEMSGYPIHRTEAAVFWAGEGAALLEIGAGCGDVLLTLSERYKECVGIELSPIRAGELKKLFRNRKNVKIINGNFESMKLDYPNEYFDTVLMIALLEHLIDPFGAIKKVFRLLKPGGRIIIDTPNMAKWTRRIKL